MLKLYFLTNGILRPTSDKLEGGAAINPSYFYLKNHFTLQSEYADQIEWVGCEFIMLDSVEDQVQRIIDKSIDILCLSVFVWNVRRQFEVAKQVKQLLPSTKIIMGGPDLDAQGDQDFFVTHPYVDYVVYGSGEKALTQILESMVTNIELGEGTCNTVVRQPNNLAVVYPFEDIDTTTLYWNSSPLIPFKQELVTLIEQVAAMGIPRKYIRLSAEFARGCMYSCSFCDWDQNLTKKVKRRKFDWKAEVDLYKELDIYVKPSDANFGQYPEDVQIFDYAMSILDQNKSYRFAVGNTPKIKKEVGFYMLAQMSKAKIRYPKISFQDLDQNVLKKINRPEISNEKMVALIDKLKTDTGNVGFNAELIFGLPGQTLTTMCQTLNKIRDMGGKCRTPFLWVLLKHSPGASPAYINEHQVKTVDVMIPSSSMNVIPYRELYMLAQHSSEESMYKLTIAYSSLTMTFTELLAMFGLSYLLNKFNYDSDLARLAPTALASVFRYMAAHQSLYEEFGYYMLAQPSDDRTKFDPLFDITI